MSLGADQRPESARHRRLTPRKAVYAALLLAVPIAATGAAAIVHAETPETSVGTTADQPFTQSVQINGDTTTWTFGLRDGRPMDYVGVHFTPKGQGQGQQSFEMNPSADGKSWTFSRPTSATTKEFGYFFVYKLRGSNVNEPTTPTFDQSGRTADPTKPITPIGPGNPSNPPSRPDKSGGFPLQIVAKDSDKNDYVTIVGQPTPGRYAYIDADGTAKPVSDQPKGMSFSLKSLRDGTVTLPAEFQGGRIFLSKKPLQMPAAKVDGVASDVGYVQPDLNNPADPNQGNPYDFFEFTFKNGANGAQGIAFGGNTTQVDGFSLPITAELKQDSSRVDTKVGLEGKSAAQVIDGYKKFVAGDKAFTSLVNAAGTHIAAPRSAKTFQGPGATYFDVAVTDAWANWNKGFKLTDGANTYQGRTVGDKLTFQKSVDGKPTGETGSVTKPTTAEVAACSGNLATGSNMEKFVEAHLCAAFNRGIAKNDPATWGDKNTYYPAGATYNKYAAYFHKENLNGLAYGFAYDDVHDQSSVMILPNSDAPTRLKLTVG
ncbi:beta-1,3-glucanase family protein [Streptomyces sp. NPDC056519]|uniref:beta-1,3-glucanase family protein n=1 Tax=Streptomyces sp. NPDC056519 TaxID=3345849 RepID=UPI0036875C86